MSRNDKLFVIGFVSFWVAFCILLQVFQPDWAFPKKAYYNCIEEQKTNLEMGLWQIGTNESDIEKYCCEEQNMSWVGESCADLRS